MDTSFEQGQLRKSATLSCCSIYNNIIVSMQLSYVLNSKGNVCMYKNLHFILFLVLHVYVHVQVHDEVSSADNCIQNVPVYVTVACFLASEGADLEIESLEGLTPLRLCPPDYLSLLKLFARPERYSNMYIVLDIQWNLSNPDTIGAD